MMITVPMLGTNLLNLKLRGKPNGSLFTRTWTIGSQQRLCPGSASALGRFVEPPLPVTPGRLGVGAFSFNKLLAPGRPGEYPAKPAHHSAPAIKRLNAAAVVAWAERRTFRPGWPRRLGNRRRAPAGAQLERRPPLWQAGTDQRVLLLLSTTTPGQPEPPLQLCDLGSVESIERERRALIRAEGREQRVHRPPANAPCRMGCHTHHAAWDTIPSHVARRVLHVAICLLHVARSMAAWGSVSCCMLHFRAGQRDRIGSRCFLRRSTGISQAGSA
jgi:hypothetical protein